MFSRVAGSGVLTVRCLISLLSSAAPGANGASGGTLSPTRVRLLCIDGPREGSPVAMYPASTSPQWMAPSRKRIESYESNADTYSLKMRGGGWVWIRASRSRVTARL